MAIFNNKTLEEGKNLFKNNKVYSYNRNGNKVSAAVKDHNKDYNVYFKLNKENKIIAMSCNCDIKNKVCSHQAALYFAFRANQIQVKQSTLDLDISKASSITLNEIYEEILTQTKGNFSIHSMFSNRLKKKIKSLNIQGNYDLQTLYYLIELIEQFDDVNYIKNYRNMIINYFSESLNTLINKDRRYALEILKWNIQRFGKTDNIDYIDTYSSTLEVLSLSQIVDTYLDILNSDNNYDCEKILIRLFDLIKNDLSYMQKCLDGLKNYEDMEIYKFYKIKNLINNKEIDEAQKQFKQTKFNNQDLYEQLEELMLPLASDIESYYKYVIRKFKQDKSIDNINLIDNLKNNYDNWYQYRNDFFNQLSSIVSRKILMQILYRQNEWKYAVDEIVRTKDFYSLNEYKDLIEKNDPEIFIFLYTLCMYNELENYSHRSDYHRIVYHFNRLKIYGCHQDEIFEIIEYIKELYPRKKALWDVLNSYIDREDNDEI